MRRHVPQAAPAQAVFGIYMHTEQQEQAMEQRLTQASLPAAAAESS